MKICVIGAGFTGLSAAYYLQKEGHSVTIFEKDNMPGGLALGYKEKEWKWTLESHYHHWFTNDKSVLSLAREIDHKVIIERPKTSSFVNDKIYQLDSPISLLKFPELSILNRLRMGVSLAFLKYNPIWKPLEHFKAEPYLKKMMGKTGYEKLWKPLMVNKLGKYAKSVSLAWFWARVYKRTSSLAYPEGGFLEFSKHLQKEIEKNGGKFYYNTEVTKLLSKEKPHIVTNHQSLIANHDFDKVIVTLPSSLFIKIAPQLPQSYIDKLNKLKIIGAINIVLRLKNPFFIDRTYWLSMCDLKSPILALVEHTNFMDKKNYNNEYLVYVGNYMETSDPRFKMTKEELLKLYDPWLTKINPNYKLSIINSKLFRAPFAQPVIPPNYSKDVPSFTTPLKNVYLANMQQVYPWDRGTNYAVELGKNIARKINESN
jgi:protoporphyrinogen oxidase